MSNDNLHNDVIIQQQEMTDDALEMRFIDDNNAIFKKTKGGFLSVEFKGVLTAVYVYISLFHLHSRVNLYRCAKMMKRVAK